MNNEDIKIVEDYLLNFDKIGGTEIIKSDEIIKLIEYKEIKAIENLLSRLKTAESEIKYWKEQAEGYSGLAQQIKEEYEQRLEDYYLENYYNED